MLNNNSLAFYFRSTGCDLEHSRAVIRTMARFHALGMATKYKQPEYFEVLKERSKCIQVTTEDFKHTQDGILKRIADDPEVGVHIDRCSATMKETIKYGLWNALPDEPWSTIVHADFWVNNIMFHRDEDDRVDDVKFVDFQNYLFFNPLREMVFFLFSSTENSNDYIDELIDLYHETFIAVLARMDCDTELFTREKFDAHLMTSAKYEFVHLIFMLKILTLNVQEDAFKQNDMKNFFISYQGNQIFVQRQRKLISHFVQRDWI